MPLLPWPTIELSRTISHLAGVFYFLFFLPFPSVPSLREPSKLHNNFCQAYFSLSTSASLPRFLSLSLLLDQALDLLVPVSSNCLQPSTSGLSPCRLQGVLLLSNGISRLEGGFTLRCLQRLSLPDLATLLCVWYATDAPAVCPFRSSRTKNSSSQISYAHDG